MKIQPFAQKVFSMLLILAFLITAIGFAWEQASAQGAPSEGYDPDSGTLIFVGASGDQPVVVEGFTASGIASSENARMIIHAYADRLGLDNDNDLAEMRETQSGDRHYYRFQQLVQGNVPIYGAEILVSTNQYGELLSLSSKTERGLTGLNIQPSINADNARTLARAFASNRYSQSVKMLSAGDAELWVFSERIFLPQSSRKPELVWKIVVDGTEANLPVREMVMINALTGKVSFNYTMIDSALDLAVYTKNHNTGTLPGSFLCDETDLPSCTSGANIDADNALSYGEDVYNFYMSEHGRDSIDNAGMLLKQTVDFGTNYQNAFWNGYQMVYGDNMVADDVVGHELTHGVTDYESELIYAYQPGAINESFSDVWGEFVDQTNGAGDDSLTAKWYMGEDIPFDFGGPDPYPGSIRYMADPTVFGDPDRVLSPNYWTATGDNGGVHINSGVNNKATYLMTDGGDFNGKTVTGLGITKVADLYYEAQTNLLIRSATFLDLYYALNQACINLGYSVGDCTEVDEALLAVEMNMRPSGGNPIAIPGKCPVGTTAATPVFSDDFELGLSKWQRGKIRTTGGQAWERVAGGVTSPDGFALHAKDLNASSDSYISMLNSVKVPNNAYMFFEHTYNIEKLYDGGWLEYSVGGTWLPMKTLIVQGQKENIYLKSSRYAFSGSSKGTTGSLVKLTTLAGKYLKVRFRMYSDYIVGYEGWYIDNVSIHRCQ